MSRQENGRRKFREKTIRKVEIHIESFEPRKLFDLLLRKDLPTDIVFDVR